MPKRHTLEFVKTEFEKEGYQLLAKEYVNNTKKLDYICPKGHRHSVEWRNWQQHDSRCPYCAGNVKKDIDFIRAEFEKEGYILLTKIYKNNMQKLEYICPNGHRHSITWGHWTQDRRCFYCYGSERHTFDFIKKEFEKEGYTLLTTNYKNEKQQLDYICPKGHKRKTTWCAWRAGRRCAICSGKYVDLNMVREEFLRRGYTLLSTEYVNAFAKLDYICPEGHKHQMSWTKFKAGRGCPSCKAINASGEGNPNWKGGIACEPYCEVWLDKDFKESIKARDNYKCQNPLCNGKFERLCVHHIDYIKKNCHPQNLITLCVSCNSKANKDREWHAAFYKEIIRRNNFSKNQTNQEDLSWKVEIL